MRRNVVAVLIAISVVGVIGIPLGDPDFLAVSIGLEASYVALTIVSIKKVKYALIPNIIIACIVIAGNTFSPTHIDVMLSLDPIYNAIILIIGGYILQGLLIGASVITYKSIRQTRKIASS
ncbi:MAG: hypothetical protein ACRD3Z_01765 [Nitrososphaerales archaeon]